MKKIFISMVALMVAFAACTEKPMPEPDQDDQQQTETPGEQPEEPGEQPEEPGDEPGNEPDVPVVFEWPNDEDAFDYGLNDLQSRTATYPEEDTANVPNKKDISNAVVIGDITYCGPGLQYYGNRMLIGQVQPTGGQKGGYWDENYPNIIPSQSYQSFKINRPGNVSFFQLVASVDGNVPRVPTYYLAVVAKIDGQTVAKVVDEYTPTTEELLVSPNNFPGGYASAEYKKYYVTLSVSKDDLEGIEEAATVYIYHKNPTKNTLNVWYAPLTWTVDLTGAAAPQRMGKILLAGDSLVTEYNESAAPQTGWGQCLAAALGGDVQVMNHAIGGESTKSFIDSGKWDTLLAGTFGDDVVMIQFMHNDQKQENASHYTDPATTYRENLKKFISDVRAKGANPVLVTSVLRRQFKNGVLYRNLGDYPAAMRAVATETNTPLIDCEEWSYGWLTELGADGAAPYYILNKRDPEKNDETHFTKEGAEMVAKYIADEMVRLGVWIK